MAASEVKRDVKVTKSYRVGGRASGGPRAACHGFRSTGNQEATLKQRPCRRAAVRTHATAVAAAEAEVRNYGGKTVTVTVHATGIRIHACNHCDAERRQPSVMVFQSVIPGAHKRRCVCVCVCEVQWRRTRHGECTCSSRTPSAHWEKMRFWVRES